MCSSISVAIFKPRPPFTTNHLIARLSSLALSFRRSTGFVRSAILKSLSGNSASPSAAVYSIWDKGLTPEDGPACPKANPYEVAVSSLADAIDVSWYEVSCWDSKGDSTTTRDALTPAQGDVVHLRKVTLAADDHRHDIGSAMNPQELLSYSCLAITKAYFHQVEGLLSCTFFRSLDGGVDGRLGQIVGLGIWQSALAARAFFTASPAECYWRSLGAKLGYELYEVVFVIADDRLTVNDTEVQYNNSSNGKLLIV